MNNVIRNLQMWRGKGEAEGERKREREGKGEEGEAEGGKRERGGEGGGRERERREGERKKRERGKGREKRIGEKITLHNHVSMHVHHLGSSYMCTYMQLNPLSQFLMRLILHAPTTTCTCTLAPILDR